MDEELDKNFEIRNFNASFSVSAIVLFWQPVKVSLFLVLYHKDIFYECTSNAEKKFSDN